MKEKQDEFRKKKDRLASSPNTHARTNAKSEDRKISKRPPRRGSNSPNSKSKGKRRPQLLTSKTVQESAHPREIPNNSLFATNLDVDKAIKGILNTIASKNRITDRFDEDYSRLWERLEKSSFTDDPFNLNFEDIFPADKQRPDVAPKKKKPLQDCPLEVRILSHCFRTAPKEQLQVIVCPEELIENSSRNWLTDRNPYFAAFEIVEKPKNFHRTETLEIGARPVKGEQLLKSTLSLIDNNYWPNQDRVTVKVPNLSLTRFEEVSRWDIGIMYRRQKQHEKEFRYMNNPQTPLAGRNEYLIEDELNMLKDTNNLFLIQDNELLESLE